MSARTYRGCRGLLMRESVLKQRAAVQSGCQDGDSDERTTVSELPRSGEAGAGSRADEGETVGLSGGDA